MKFLGDTAGLRFCPRTWGNGARLVACAGVLFAVAGCRIGFEQAELLGGSDATPPDAAADAAIDAEPDALVQAPLCSEVPRLGSPTIDGLLESGLLLEDVEPLGWTVEGGVPAGNSMAYAVAIVPEGLYFFVQVADPELVPPEPNQDEYCGDGVEIYFSVDGVAPPTDTLPNYLADDIQGIIAAPIDGAGPSTRGSLWRNAAFVGPWEGNIIAMQVAGGYVVEGIVDATAVGVPSIDIAPGARIGFDLSHNISYSDGTIASPTCRHRLGQYFATIDETQLLETGAQFPYQNAAAFCYPLVP